MANPVRLKELAHKEDLLTGGHRACPGCSCAVILRQMLIATEDPVVIAFPVSLVTSSEGKAEARVVFQQFPNNTHISCRKVILTRQ